jgi:hypothetical protein
VKKIFLTIVSKVRFEVFHILLTKKKKREKKKEEEIFHSLRAFRSLRWFFSCLNGESDILLC